MLYFQLLNCILTIDLLYTIIETHLNSPSTVSRYLPYYSGGSVCASIMVSDSGVEPLTSSMSTKRSTAELTGQMKYKLVLLGGAAPPFRLYQSRVILLYYRSYVLQQLNKNSCRIMWITHVRGQLL